MKGYILDNKIVRNAGLGFLSLLSMLGLSGCYESNTTNYDNRTEPTKVIIQEKVIIEKEFVPAPNPSYNQPNLPQNQWPNQNWNTGNRPWSEPTPYPPHPKGDDPRFGNNNTTNQYPNQYTGTQDHPKGLPYHPVP